MKLHLCEHEERIINMKQKLCIVYFRFRLIFFFMKERVGSAYIPSLATSSASITAQPKSSFNILATVLFPEAIPPVSPTKNIARQEGRFTGC